MQQSAGNELEMSCFLLSGAVTPEVFGPCWGLGCTGKCRLGAAELQVPAQGTCGSCSSCLACCQIEPAYSQKNPKNLELFGVKNSTNPTKLMGTVLRWCL